MKSDPDSLSWLDGDDREQCEWALGYLAKRKMPVWSDPQGAHASAVFSVIKAYPDPAARALFIRAMNDAWRQEKTRRKKRARGLVPTEITIARGAKSRLKALAARSGLTQSEVVEVVIEQGFENEAFFRAHSKKGTGVGAGRGKTREFAQRVANAAKELRSASVDAPAVPAAPCLQGGQSRWAVPAQALSMPQEVRLHPTQLLLPPPGCVATVQIPIVQGVRLQDPVLLQGRPLQEQLLQEAMSPVLGPSTRYQYIPTGAVLTAGSVSRSFVLGRAGRWQMVTYRSEL